MHALNQAASLRESTDYYVAEFRAMTEKLYLTAPLLRGSLFRFLLDEMGITG
jgi:hypothetical protein